MIGTFHNTISSPIRIEFTLHGREKVYLLMPQEQVEIEHDTTDVNITALIDDETKERWEAFFKAQGVPTQEHPSGKGYIVKE